jgi:hypothetical protein
MANDQLNTFTKLETIFGTPETTLPAIAKSNVIENDKQLPAVTNNSFPDIAELEDDYQLARQTIRTLLEKSEHTVDNMLTLAVQSESARAFEVAGKLIETMSGLAQNLIGLHEKTQKAKKTNTNSDETAPKTIVQNNTTNQQVVFQGSSSDLFSMVEK